MSEKTCINCKHWGKRTGDKLRNCFWSRRVQPENTQFNRCVCPDRPIAINNDDLSDFNNRTMDIYTPGDFCCIRHQLKETNNEK